MVGRLLARYTTSDTGGDQARVAGFHINIKADDSTSLPLGIGLGDTTGVDTKQQVDFTVSGSTEVAMEYELLVELTHADGTAMESTEWEAITPKMAPVILGEVGTKKAAETVTPAADGKSCIYTFQNISDSGTAKEQIAPAVSYTQDYRLTFDSMGSGNTDGFQVKIYIDGQQID